MSKLQSSASMDTIMVLPQNAEQKRTIEAFLTALKIHYLPVKATLEELEARLLPGQQTIWNNLKAGLVWVEDLKSGRIPPEQIKTLEQLLTEYEDANFTN